MVGPCVQMGRSEGTTTMWLEKRRGNEGMCYRGWWAAADSRQQMRDDGSGAVCQEAQREAR